MRFSERIPHFTVFTKERSKPSREKAKRELLLWLVGGIAVALILILIFRPQWLGLAGKAAGNAGAALGLAAGAVANPFGWVV